MENGHIMRVDRAKKRDRSDREGDSERSMKTLRKRVAASAEKDAGEKTEKEGKDAGAKKDADADKEKKEKDADKDKKDAEKDKKAHKPLKLIPHAEQLFVDSDDAVYCCILHTQLYTPDLSSFIRIETVYHHCVYALGMASQWRN
jgi:hypothetical protein